MEKEITIEEEHLSQCIALTSTAWMDGSHSDTNWLDGIVWVFYRPSCSLFSLKCKEIKV